MTCGSDKWLRSTSGNDGDSWLRCVASFGLDSQSGNTRSLTARLFVVSLSFADASMRNRNMDPRSLIGPTFLVMMLIVATLGTLFLLEPDNQEELSPEDVYSMTAEEFKSELASRMGRQMNRRLIYFAVIAVLICIVPMGRTTRITRWFILAAIGMGAKFFTGQQADAITSLTKMCFLGAVIVGGLVVLKFYSKAVDNGKRPAMERWAPRRTQPRLSDDPETLAKLDRLRDVATLPPPRVS